jgi:hypothetical protein
MGARSISDCNEVSLKTSTDFLTRREPVVRLPYSEARLSTGSYATDRSPYIPTDFMRSRKPTRTKLSRWLMRAKPSMHHHRHHITITVINHKHHQEIK